VQLKDKVFELLWLKVLFLNKTQPLFYQILFFPKLLQLQPPLLEDQMREILVRLSGLV
jgi:hypothetical protein